MIYTNELDKDSVQKAGKDPTLSNSSDTSDGDPEFHVTAEMLVHGVDNERTLEEEESFDDVDHAAEIAELQKESELPIEDLFAMYYGGGTDIESQKENMPDASEHEDGMDTGDVQKSDTKRTQENGQGGIKRTHEEMEKSLWREEGGEDGRHSDRLRIDINSSGEDYIGDRNGDDFDPFFNQRITRGLAALNSQYFDEEYSTDEEYQPTIDNWKKDVQIGDDFQAEVDEGISHYTNGERDDDGDKLLWKPDVVTPSQLQTFLEFAYKLDDMNTQTPERDDEQVLFTLLQTRNVDSALRRRHQQARKGPDVSLWSEEECQNFEQGLRVFGKDFRLIQRNKVKTRTVGEIVQFYYLWKKTERHDAFVMQTKFGRKKYTLPGIADVMGRFMEENESVFSSRSTSPNFEQSQDNQSSNSTNGDYYSKETDEPSEKEERNLNYPIFGKEKDNYFENDFTNNAGWRRTSPTVSVVSTN